MGLALADAASAEAACLEKECDAIVAAAFLDKEAAKTACAEVQEASRIAEEWCVVFQHELCIHFEPRRTNKHHVSPFATRNTHLSYTSGAPRALFRAACTERVEWLPEM